MSFKLSITIIAFISLAIIVTQSTTNYKGVSWDEKKNLWQAEFYVNGKKSKCYFENELDAAKKINQLCKNMKISLKNPKPGRLLNQPDNLDLLEVLNPQKKEKEFQSNTGVNQNKKKKKLQSEVKLNYGGNFNNGLFLTVRKSLDQICEMKTPLKNFELSPIPTQKICEEMRISSPNSEIYAIPTQQTQKQLKDISECISKTKNHDKATFLEQWLKIMKHKKEQKVSQYDGVYWHVESGKWYAHLSLSSGERKYGGIFDEELDAAKKVNHLCEELKIAPLNPGASRIHNFEFLVLPEINPKRTYSREFPKLTTISRKQKIQDSNQTIIIDANASEISKS